MVQRRLDENRLLSRLSNGAFVIIARPVRRRYAVSILNFGSHQCEVPEHFVATMSAKGRHEAYPGNSRVTVLGCQHGRDIDFGSARANGQWMIVRFHESHSLFKSQMAACVNQNSKL